MQKQFTRGFDLLYYQRDRYGQDAAINIFNNNEWQPTSITQLIKKVNNASCWLLNQGYKKGDKIGIMPNQGNLDWLIIDFACQQIGVVLVPLHPTYATEELDFIITETAIKLLVVIDEIGRAHV